jgi:hypothetical protein
MKFWSFGSLVSSPEESAATEATNPSVVRMVDLV